MPQVLKRVGRYDVLEVIGRGGAAVVYLAQQRDLMRHVALKELAPYQASDTSFAERFVEESRLAGSMNHANVVTVHEYFEDGGVPYIAMEYLPYGSLRQYVGKLSTAQIAGVLEGVLAGLSHGEARGIAHRDLKPENLLVAADGRVKIADFGVARAYNKAATRVVVTVDGTTIGTPVYMSPEQALGHDLTPATDLYSLGIVAWELLTGQVPFEEKETPVAVLYRHVHEPVPSVRTVAPEVDERLAAWLERMLEKQPEDRFPGADAAWLALEDVVLDLLGPRWRREARVIVDDREQPDQNTLTPASFDAVEPPVPVAAEPAPPANAAAPKHAGVAVAETVSGAAASDMGTTVAPKQQAPRSRTTLLRLARRHQDSQSAEGAAHAGLRRRAAVAVIVVAMAAGAAGGAILAGTGKTKHRTDPGPARRAAAIGAANKQLTGIVAGLAAARNHALPGLLHAHSSRDQATAAAAVQRVYATAEARVTPLVGKSPAAGPLRATLSSTASAYGRLATAARLKSPAKWSEASSAVKSDETQLQSEVAKL